MAAAFGPAQAGVSSANTRAVVGAQHGSRPQQLPARGDRAGAASAASAASVIVIAYVLSHPHVFIARRMAHAGKRFRVAGAAAAARSTVPAERTERQYSKCAQSSTHDKRNHTAAHHRRHGARRADPGPSPLELERVPQRPPGHHLRRQPEPAPPNANNINDISKE